MESWTVDLNQPEQVSDADLTAALEVLNAELARRSEEASDPDSLTELGFERGFDDRGRARDPWLQDHILVVPGSKQDRSASSHRCRFVRIGAHWVWESPARFADTVRYPPGPRGQMRSITLATVNEGDAIDVIESRSRTGSHELMAVTSYLVRSGKLEVVSSRTVRPEHDR